MIWLPDQHPFTPDDIREEPNHPWLKVHEFPERFDLRKWRSENGARCERRHEAEQRQRLCALRLKWDPSPNSELADRYGECSAQEPCGICMEPRCTRMFRINFVGHAVRLLRSRYSKKQLTLVTVVHPCGHLYEGQLHTTSLYNVKAQARSKLIAADLRTMPAIGGVDVSWNVDGAGHWIPHWQFHVHFVAAGKSTEEINAHLRPEYPDATEEIPKPVMVKPVTDLIGALNYTVKAIFYQRYSYIEPKTGHRNTKSRQRLPTPQFQELAQFMSTQKLGDRLFLRHVRRRGDRLEFGGEP